MIDFYLNLLIFLFFNQGIVIIEQSCNLDLYIRKMKIDEVKSSKKVVKNI